MSLQGSLFFIYKRILEAKNVKSGGELMYLDVLLLDSKRIDGKRNLLHEITRLSPKAKISFLLVLLT
ncbi:unnamed protein product [Brassica napus]|uniref:(rape) hypothetical protein n=1 Tax=Brassica napus TaxID=3708 RepID=A0A816JVF9_BRANA|nr:unnamed protein product [Brassica napus]